MGQKSISKITAEALRKKPHILCTLDRGIVNLSALATYLLPEIRKKRKDASQAAIKTAIRRFVERRGKSKMPGLIGILKNSQLTLKNNIARLILSHDAYPKLVKFQQRLRSEDYLNFLKQASAIVVILDEHNLSSAQRGIPKSEVFEKSKGFSAIFIASPKTLIGTPGFIALLSSLLAHNNINIEEVFSCYTDTVIVVKRKDALKSFELLEGLTKET